MIMKRNTNPEFAGLQKIKDQQREQLELFEEWASKNQWGKFHLSHYDWWMFPIDEPSSYRYMYVVYEGDIEELKKDSEYIRNYLRGVELLALSWGWDLKKRGYISDPMPDQAWQDWPIRLFKASKSLKLFGFKEEFESMRMYAKDLIEKGEDMTYRGKDLSWLFK